MMFFVKIKKSMLLLVCLCSMLLHTQVQAHPHSWISLQTEIVGDGEHILGFNMSWTFDSITSAYMLDGKDLSSANKSQTLTAIAKSVMRNINLEHYFTYFYDDKEPIKFTFSEKAALRQNKTKLTLDFYAPLSKPKKISNNPLKLLIFEPSYYVDMSWENRNDIQLSPELSKHCAFDLIEPNPSSEQLAYATSLGIDENSDEALGELFTQTVTITCRK